MPNDLIFISDVIYGLKHEYGETISINHEETSTDLNTGEKTVTLTSVTIPLAIPMPETMRQQMTRLFQAKKEGYLNPGEQEFLIDKSDLPPLNITLRDFVMHDGVRKDISKIGNYQYAMILTTKIV